MKKTISTLMMLVAAVLLATGCKHNTKEDPAPTPSKKQYNTETRLAPVYFKRYVNSSGAHYYTAISEVETISIPASFKAEGNVCRTFPAPDGISAQNYKGLVPLYTYFNRINGDNFHTTNFKELGNGNGAYVYGGILTYVFAENQSNNPALLMPVYRYYHPVFGYHFYTNNINELASNNFGYVYEGIAFYGARLN